jgi:hypothetical protein
MDKWVGMIRDVNGHDLHVLLDTLFHDYSSIKASLVEFITIFHEFRVLNSLQSKLVACDLFFFFV